VARTAKTRRFGAGHHRSRTHGSVFEEVTAHPIPTDLEAVKLLSSPLPSLICSYGYLTGALPRKERIPIFGPFGLVQQLGAIEYARRRKFREKLHQWLKTIRLVWPECPAEITADGENLKIKPATSIHSSALAQDPAVI
jgi:hypothetical protein